jgi:hypothetical protein
MSVDTWYPAGHNEWCSVNLTPERFAFRVNYPAIKELDFHSACDLTAQLLYQEWNSRPLYLSLSGGLDSEVIANTFVRNHIPFVPVILKVGDLNAAESWYAEYWCHQHNTKPLIKTVNIAEYEDIVKKYLLVIRNTHQTGIVANLYLADFIEQLGGYYVNGVGDINQSQDQFYCNIVDFALDVFRPNQHPTGFFMYTAELALAYIKMFDTEIDEQYNKLKFYNVSPRPKIEWVQQVKHSSERLSTMLELWRTFVSNSQPHWFGNKQNVINVLKESND